MTIESGYPQIMILANMAIYFGLDLLEIGMVEIWFFHQNNDQITITMYLQFSCLGYDFKFRYQLYFIYGHLGVMVSFTVAIRFL